MGLRVAATIYAGIFRTGFTRLIGSIQIHLAHLVHPVKNISVSSVVNLMINAKFYKAPGDGQIYFIQAGNVGKEGASC